MLRRTLLATPLLAAAAPATWPSRPIRVINPYPAGSPEAMARFLADRMGAALGQPVVVESRSGAGGTIGAEFVAHAPPDGYVLGVSGIGPHAIAPATFAGLRYDPLRDATHLALLGELPLALAVDAAGPFRDLDGVLAAARQRPGELRIGTVGSGGLGDLGLAILRRATGATVTAVPFRGATAAALEVMGGRIEGVLASVGELGGQDRLRLLALAAEARLPRFAAVPLFREAGIDLVAMVWFGLCAPGGLPAPVAARLEREARAATAGEGYAALLAGLGASPHRDLDAAAMTAFVAAEGVRWGEAARAAGIRAE